MNSRKWISRGLSFEWCRANQIRTARKRFAERGEGRIEWLMSQRIWGYKEKIFGRTRNKQTDQMMRNVLMHANPECSEQRSTTAEVPDPKISKQDVEEKLEWCIRVGTF